MKVTFNFENGMELSLKPENVSLSESNKGVALVTKTNEQVLALLLFPNTSLATPEELAARAAKAAAEAAAAKAAAEAVPNPPAPAAPAAE